MNILTQLKQRLCRHKNADWYVIEGGNKYKFEPLNGQRNYLICNKCGKILGSYLLEGGR